MITLGSETVFDTKCAALVFLRDGKVTLPAFYLHEELFLEDLIWNGYGGFWETSDGDIYNTAIRELFRKSKRTQVVRENLRLGGVVDFAYSGKKKKIPNAKIFFFSAWDYSKEPEATKKTTKPSLFSVREAPYEKMLPASETILPAIMSGKRVTGRVSITYQKDGTRSVDISQLFVAYS